MSETGAQSNMNILWGFSFFIIAMPDGPSKQGSAAHGA